MTAMAGVAARRCLIGEKRHQQSSGSNSAVHSVQVLITVLVNGGGTYYLLKFWGLQASQGGEEPRSSMELAPMLSSRWSHGSPTAVLTTEHNLHHPSSPTVTCATGLAATTVQPRCVCGHACPCDQRRL